MASWISTGIGPFRVGRSFQGNSQDPKSPFVHRALGIWFLLVIATFFTVPVLTAVLLVGLIPLIIACMVAEATHRTPEQLSERQDRQALELRTQHLAGRKTTNRALALIRVRPELEFVIYPERKPLDPFPYFTDSDRGWFTRHGGDIPEAE